MFSVFIGVHLNQEEDRNVYFEMPMYFETKYLLGPSGLRSVRLLFDVHRCRHGPLSLARRFDARGSSFP